MKKELTIEQLAFLRAIMDNTPFTQTELAKVIFGQIGTALTNAEKERKALISSYEEEIEEKAEDGTISKRVTVPQDKIPELNEKLLEMKTTIEFNQTVYLTINQVVRNFPEVIVDKQGNKGLTGSRDILMYESIKEEFCG